MSKKQWGKGFFDGLKKGKKKGRFQGATIATLVTAAIALLIDSTRKK